LGKELLSDNVSGLLSDRGNEDNVVFPKILDVRRRVVDEGADQSEERERDVLIA
jgi:hypothetical protein